MSRESNPFVEGYEIPAKVSRVPLKPNGKADSSLTVHSVERVEIDYTSDELMMSHLSNIISSYLDIKVSPTEVATLLSLISAVQAKHTLSIDKFEAAAKDMQIACNLSTKSRV